MQCSKKWAYSWFSSWYVANNASPFGDITKADYLQYIWFIMFVGIFPHDRAHGALAAL